MAMTQNYATHRRYVPLYHFVLSAILLANLVIATVVLVRAPGKATAWHVVMAVAFLLIYLYIRVFPITVQNRVIRLEMQLRLQRILPADLQARVSELSVGHLVALRFAGDAEMPELVRKCLAEPGLSENAVKRLIKTWVPDTLRA